MKEKRFRSAIIKSALVHVCVLLLIAISPGFDLPLKEKPVDVVWVELPKGTSDEIGWGIKEAKGLPGATIEQTKQPPATTQKPMEAVPQKQPTVEKSVTATARMTYSSKGAPRRSARTKTDRKIADALAMIDKSLSDRSAPPESSQLGGRGDGYKYGTGTQPLRVPPSDPEYLKYQAQVRARIINNWVIPERFASEDRTANAKLVVMINMNGEVVSTRWAKKSGVTSFDSSARRAVERASPFPKPPQRLAWETYNEGFLIEFDARAR